MDPLLRLFVVESEAALAAVARANNLNLSNMRHLIGLHVGNGKASHVTGWKRLEQVCWIAKEGGTPVPVPHDRDSFCQHLGHPFLSAKLGKLLNGTLWSHGKLQHALHGWSVVPAPTNAAQQLCVTSHLLHEATPSVHEATPSVASSFTAAGIVKGQAVDIQVWRACGMGELAAATKEAAAHVVTGHAVDAQALAAARQAVAEAEAKRAQTEEKRVALEAEAVSTAERLGVLEANGKELEQQNAELQSEVEKGREQLRSCNMKYEEGLAAASAEVSGLKERIETMARAPAAGNLLKTMEAMRKALAHLIL